MSNLERGVAAELQSSGSLLKKFLSLWERVRVRAYIRKQAPII